MRPSIKKDFPIFQHKPDLVYLDSTATSLKPRSVIDKLRSYYEEYSANIHRGIYKIAEQATAEYEQTREITASFIGAARPEEIVFTRNATEALNMVAYSHGRQIVQKGDEIITTIMEHHSNFVPWQQLAFENGADFKVLHVTEEGRLDLDLARIDAVLNRRTKIVALTYVSNVLGVINSIKEIIAAIKKVNKDIIVVIDAAQAVPHIRLNVQELGCDFLAFSSHKMLGPTGVGVLWGKYHLLQEMFPFQYGGEMIAEVAIEKTTFKNPPHKFEAGTPHIAGVIALKEAITYLKGIGMDAIHQHEQELAAYAIKALTQAYPKEVHIIGPGSAESRAGIVTFTFGTFHPHDIAQILDESSIAVRAGHHCTMPLHKALGIPASTRASFYIYNEKSDVDKLVEGLGNVVRVLHK